MPRLCHTWKLLPAVMPLLLILPRSSVMMSDMPELSCCVTSSRYSLAVSIVSNTCTCLSRFSYVSSIWRALQAESAHALHMLLGQSRTKGDGRQRCFERKRIMRVCTLMEALRKALSYQG